MSEKLPSLKGSNATYNQNRWPFDTDTFVKPVIVRFLENSFSSEYSATLQQMYQGDVEARFLKVNLFQSFMGSWHEVGTPKTKQSPVQRP